MVVDAEVEVIVYIRTTRADTPIIYSPTDQFPLGGSRVLKFSSQDRAAIVAAGITVHEALSAHEALEQEGIFVRVIDCYSIKPLDCATLKKAAEETGAIITVEDHFKEGGLGEAVASVLATNRTPVYTMAVEKMPRSGKPKELLEYENISKDAIVRKVKEIVHNRG